MIAAFPLTTSHVTERDDTTVPHNRVFHDKIKLYVLRQNLHETCFNVFFKCEMVHETNFNLRSAT